MLGPETRGPERHDPDEVVFPRSELNLALDDSQHVARRIDATASSGVVDVVVREHAPLRLRAVYRFSAALVPESVTLSESYWETHRRFSESGQLDHAPETCAERTKGMTVRVWDAEAGWQDVLVPYAVR